jgi:hypothetical protein
VTGWTVVGIWVTGFGLMRRLQPLEAQHCVFWNMLLLLKAWLKQELASRQPLSTVCSPFANVFTVVYVRNNFQFYDKKIVNRGKHVYGKDFLVLDLFRAEMKIKIPYSND